ncbi:MAG: tryptophan synthase subunit alpha [Candidatus Aminicenantes bacterium]|nr:tryptophan synthase subunit alpha [Candidatus Aminicenantes bacterium]
MARPSESFPVLLASGRKAFIPFFTGLFPDRALFRELLLRADDAGADWIEIGVPFSDPLADGEVIRSADRCVLNSGFAFKKLLEELNFLKKRLRAGFILMAYFNTILQESPADMGRMLAEAGIQGLIVPDLPLEESAPWEECFDRAGVDLIPLVAPTTSKQRMHEAGRRKGGFIYLVSLTGVTGMREHLPRGLSEYVLSVRKQTDKPLCIGFGISTPLQAKKVGLLCDGVIVGSALIHFFLGKEKDFSALRRASSLMKNIRKALDGLGNGV